MDRADLYVDAEGDYRWVRTSPNGDIVGASTEGYERRIDAVENYGRGNAGPDAPKLEEGKLA